MITVDLRSDTVTRPGPEMRARMAEAEVGDDDYLEDPTVNRLQERVAELLGTEAAIYVPSGTMANQIAIALQTRPGDEMLVGADAHNWLLEGGAAAALSGVQPCQLPGDGRFTAADVRAGFKEDNYHLPRTSMLSVENSHNMGGGLVWDPDELRAVADAGRALGLAVHLDGARLWNAAVACGRSEKELCAGFDTISVCLSKGLGAPVGSLLAGSAAMCREAYRFRKRFGGQMRQAGILAAAGLYAIDHHRDRLADDHANARYLAEAVGALPGLSVDLDRVMTNIVRVDTDGDAADLERRASERGLEFIALGRNWIRLVTHLDVDRAACERAVAILGELVAGE
jgi:threonine aldolase